MSFYYGRKPKKPDEAKKKTDVDDIDIGSSNGLVYNPIPLGEEWKVDFAEELVEMKSNRHGVDLSTAELDEILREVTT